MHAIFRLVWLHVRLLSQWFFCLFWLRLPSLTLPLLYRVIFARCTSFMICSNNVHITVPIFYVFGESFCHSQHFYLFFIQHSTLGYRVMSSKPWKKNHKKCILCMFFCCCEWKLDKIEFSGIFKQTNYEQTQWNTKNMHKQICKIFC